MSKTRTDIQTDEKEQVRIRWCCPMCEESIRFHPHDIDLLDYFAARHLVRKHDLDPVEAAAYASDLRERMAECWFALEECQACDGNGHANHPQD